MTPPPEKATKISRVLAMLSKPKGASLDALCKATGWQPHSARAALSGLRKAGHVIERLPGDGKKGGSIYRVIAATEAPK